jgi:hypothetical protein
MSAVLGMIIYFVTGFEDDHRQGGRAGGQTRR